MNASDLHVFVPAWRRGWTVLASAAVMILMMTAAMLLPEEAALFAQPQSEGWARSHWIWTALLATGALGLGVLLREPASTRRSPILLSYN